jgi:hypothetical protein
VPQTFAVQVAAMHGSVGVGQSAGVPHCTHELETQIGVGEEQVGQQLPGTHVAPQQTPPVHAVESGATGLEQAPVVGSHTPVRWHSSSGLQVTAAPAQLPSAWQESPVVHLSPSSHDAPRLTEIPQ